MANLIKTTNPFTGLPSYRVGDVTITALHNHEPYGGNWTWIVGQRGENVIMHSLPVAQMAAVQVATGQRTMADLADTLDA